MPVQMIRLDNMRFNGDEILGEVEEKDNTVVIKQPMMLMMQKEGLTMVPWLMFAQKQEVTLNKSDILFQYVPKTELVNAYKERTGGLVTVPAGVLDSNGKIVGT